MSTKKTFTPAALKLPLLAAAGFCLTVLALGASEAFAADSAQASQAGQSFDAFKVRVENEAKAHGVKVDVSKELAGSDTHEAAGDATEQRIKAAAGKVAKIDRVVDMNISSARAIKSADGKIIYMADMGRFVFTGPLYDIWEKKQLKTIDEIAEAVRHINLKHMGFKPETVNLARLGTGKEHVTVFVYPLCG